MKKVLIANRGEIALRIIRACHELGLATVAVYSSADAESLHVLHADEAICIGPPSAKDSYLKISTILSACEMTGADAVHPGYGFLSEQADAAAIVESCGLKWIGPSSKAIGLLGDKVSAKAMAKKSLVPTVPGSEGIVGSLAQAKIIAEEIGYPVVIKASAGGGGRGIRFVERPEELEKSFQTAQSEAQVSFGNPNVYLEKMIVTPRHIEVQIFGDGTRAIHLGERDCTIQRRRQKLIEEAPSPILTKEQRDFVGNASVMLAQAAHYASAGTVEYLLDKEGRFYFMEVNTRIQVEHTVTEELTGVDLVREQLKLAMGIPFTLEQKDIKPKGWAIQFRINAEDPLRAFAPCPGRLEHFIPPGGPHIRVDSACYSGYSVPPYYDSLLAKLIVRGKDRKEALAVALRALNEFRIEGIRTTLPFHRFMVQDQVFQSGRGYDLTYVDGLMAKGAKLGCEEE